MDILTLIVVGLIAGLLASLVVGGTGYGILCDIAIGIIGSLVGTWLFGVLNSRVPFSGLGGTIFVAFIGAVLSLLVLRLVRRSPGRA